MLLGFSLVLHGEVPKDDLLGIVVGHGMYFFMAMCFVLRWSVELDSGGGRRVELDTMGRKGC